MRKQDNNPLEYRDVLARPLARRCKVLSAVRRCLLPDNVRYTRWAQGSSLDIVTCAGQPTVRSIDKTVSRFAKFIVRDVIFVLALGVVGELDGTTTDRISGGGNR
mmetsp:Transcript_4253/g.12037  ORF Transcript_4253/g.12037 Transcript_4253/m.12037 type:complete len:105 (-) Transcript_4253:275-589(-)